MNEISKREIEGKNQEIANRESRARERYSCAFFDQLGLRGSGTFVSYGNRKFILTADHVIEGDLLKVPIKEQKRHSWGSCQGTEVIGLSTKGMKIWFTADCFEVYRTTPSEEYGIEGPDIALIEFIPSEKIELITSKASYYPLENVVAINLDKTSNLLRNGSGFLLFGCPKDSIDEEGLHALAYFTREGTYYRDENADWWNLPFRGGDHIKTLGGVSGGGIWETHGNTSTLCGLAYYENVSANLRYVVGHGPLAICDLLAKAQNEQFNETKYGCRHKVRLDYQIVPKSEHEGVGAD